MSVVVVVVMVIDVVIQRKMPPVPKPAFMNAYGELEVNPKAFITLAPNGGESFIFRL
jgi:hypothetical protein